MSHLAMATAASRCHSSTDSHAKIVNWEVMIPEHCSLHMTWRPGWRELQPARFQPALFDGLSPGSRQACRADWWPQGFDQNLTKDLHGLGCVPLQATGLFD